MFCFCIFFVKFLNLKNVKKNNLVIILKFLVKCYFYNLMKMFLGYINKKGV